MTGKNYAAECAMKCEDKKFQHSLRGATKLPVSSKDEAAAAIRVLCKVESRREFNETLEGNGAWLRAKRLYGLWRAGHGTNAVGRRHKPNIMGWVAFSRGATIGDNPFEQPALDNNEETDFDLWELGWRKAAREYAR